jgi:hypothetical protein
MPTEGIWFSIPGTGTVKNSEVKFQKFFCPMNLTLIQNFGGCEISQISVIGKDQNRESSSMAIWSPMFEGFHYCQ